MDAKKLTLAVSFMMVLAAAFVLVVPSESDDAAAAFEITEAKFTEGKSGYNVKVTFSAAVQSGDMTLYFGEDVIKYIEIAPGSTYAKTSVGKTLAEGVYDVVVNSDKGTATAQITWPTVNDHDIVVFQAQGGTIAADKTTAKVGETVTITVTPEDDYKLKSLYVNGKAIEGTTFTMPDTDVSVTAVFEAKQCTVTFVIAEGFSKEVDATVGVPMQAPEDPEVIGAEFEGWYTEDGVKFDFETEIEGDMTLYAHFVPITPEKAATAVFIGATQTGDAKLRVTIDADEGYVPAGKITGKIAFAYQKEILPGVMVWETGYSDIEEITVTNEGQYGLFVGYIDLVAEHIEYANNFQLSYEVDGKVIGQTAKIEYASA